MNKSEIKIDKNSDGNIAVEVKLEKNCFV